MDLENRMKLAAPRLEGDDLGRMRSGKQELCTTPGYKCGAAEFVPHQKLRMSCKLRSQLQPAISGVAGLQPSAP